MWRSDPTVYWGVAAFWLVVLPFVIAFARQIYINNRTLPTPTPVEAEQVTREVAPSHVEIQQVLTRARTIQVPLDYEQRKELLIFAIALCGVGKLAQHPVFRAMRQLHSRELKMLRAVFLHRLQTRFAGILLPIDYTGKGGNINFSTEDTRTSGVIDKILDNPELCKVLCGICSIYNWELVSVYRDYCEQPGRPVKLNLIATGVFDKLFRHAGTTMS